MNTVYLTEKKIQSPYHNGVDTVNSVVQSNVDWHQTTAPIIKGVPFLCKKCGTTHVEPTEPPPRATPRTPDEPLILSNASHLPVETASDTPLTLCDGAPGSHKIYCANNASVERRAQKLRHIKKELDAIADWLDQYNV